VYATMASVFPVLETWQTTRGDLLILGTRRPLPANRAALEARIAEEPFKSALLSVWRAVDLNAFLAHYVAGDALPRALAGSPHAEVNTDDRNIVEFGFARSVGRAGASLIAELRHLSASLGAGRLPLDNANGVDWQAVDTAWLSYVISDGPVANALAMTDLAARAQPAEIERRLALLAYYDGDLGAAREHWNKHVDGPRDPNELAMAADLDSQQGSDAALAHLDRLRAIEPEEAGVILAALRLKQGRLEEAADATEAALLRFRTDPWPMLRFKNQSLDMAGSLVDRDNRYARRMFDALREPFAIRAVNEDRLLLQFRLARFVDFTSLCREPIASLEPYVPWNQSFLSLRLECYESAGDPRASRARQDLESFLSQQAIPLASGVVGME